MTTLEVLKAARAKIAQGWTQGVYARDASAEATTVTNPRAVCWCAIGAIAAASPGDVTRGVATRVVESLVKHHGLAGWNDAPGRTQAEVLALFDKAIAAEEAAKS